MAGKPGAAWASPHGASAPSQPGFSQHSGLRVTSSRALGVACANMSELILCITSQPCIQCWQSAMVGGSISTMKTGKCCKSRFSLSPQRARLPVHEFPWWLASPRVSEPRKPRGGGKASQNLAIGVPKYHPSSSTGQTSP